MRCFKSIDDVDCFKSVNEPFWFSFRRLMAAFIMLPWLTPPFVLFYVATSSDWFFGDDDCLTRLLLGGMPLLARPMLAAV